MSTAAAAEVTVPKKGKKKLLIIVGAAVVALLLAGGVAMMMMKKSAAAAAEGEDGADAEHAAPAKSAKHDPKAVPTFSPLEPFTVNLADREAERYAQVGITLELADPHVADQVKAYMPAIRNNILMALAEKTAAQLMDREGKAKLAEQIKRETSKAMGVEVEEPEEADAEGEKPKKGAAKKKKKKAEAELPITAVHFSNFIIQ